MRLFATRGYEMTTVDDIVETAGLTKPALYRHFESKQELCVALMERFRDELVAAPLARLSPGSPDLRAQVHAMLEAWLGYVEEHPDAARLLFRPFFGDAEIERVQHGLFDRQRATQVALLREFVPGLAVEESEPLGEAFRSSLVSVAMWWLDHPDVPRRVPIEALLALTYGTIAALNARAETSEGG